MVSGRLVGVYARFTGKTSAYGPRTTQVIHLSSLD